jgi:hypothetical protein
MFVQAKYSDHLRRIALQALLYVLSGTSEASSHKSGHLIHMARRPTIFDEKYRVVAIQGDQLVIRGVVSGNVLTIMNPSPATPLTIEEYPPGKLIALSDPSAAPLN